MKANAFRRYCQLKGIKGKHKKGLRKELLEREKKRASASVAPVTDELFYQGAHRA